MRIVVDVVHPANVLFFSRPIKRLLRRGDEVLILSRHKDVAPELLDSFQLPHLPISTAGNGLLGLAKELIVRDVRVLHLARRFRPNVMIGFGGVAISHVGRLLGIPTISFYDTEVATRQTRITWPFISHLYVPSSYRGRGPKLRMSRVPGIKELSYFHPSAFHAKPDVALRAGIAPDRDNFLIRVVSWRANHDLGKSGWPEDSLISLAHHLAARGKVHISTERRIPDELREFQYSGSPADMHHVLANCRLYIGESATMACEAAVLGTPSIYASDDFRGYIDELCDAGLVTKIGSAEVRSITAIVDRFLSKPPRRFHEARNAYLADKPDWSEVVVNAIDRHAK